MDNRLPVIRSFTAKATGNTIFELRKPGVHKTILLNREELTHLAQIAIDQLNETKD